MFVGKCFVEAQSISVSGFLMLHLRSISVVLHWYRRMGTAHLRLLSKSEPPSLLYLPWLCSFPIISACDSWGKTGWMKEEGREMRSNVQVKKLTTTSVSRQILKLQGYKFRHLLPIDWNKKESLLSDPRQHWSPSRSPRTSLKHCLPNPNSKRNEVKHLAPSTSSIPCFASYLFRLSFAYFCCSCYQITNSHESLYLMKVIDQTSTWQRRLVYYCVPKLGFGLGLLWVRLQQK